MKYSEALHIYQQRHDCFPKKGSAGFQEIEEIMMSDEPAIVKAKKTAQKEKVKAFLQKYIRRRETRNMGKVLLGGQYLYLHRPSNMMYRRDKVTGRRGQYEGLYNPITRKINDELSEEEALEQYRKKK